ncbi:alkaline phosphatase isoform A [Chlorella sorokiniana]|uniref:Alkaline phosphatase isoform A n=1 Tax=Chlorella sorokiniana TaxID=3076 RepID=A0A2P6TX11_CHLSO|nr:alkaline phosphatase isoform A [Chlorella sorokiniana]|eukprot:PRW58605.1 alkaline phosphatase isoform A [Chlorella sorokiniana]
MDSGLWRQYETEYCTKATELSNRVEGLAALAPEQRRSGVRDLEAAVREAEQLLQRMDMEARSYSPDQARQLLQKVKEYKADLAALKEKARRGAAGAGGGPDARAELGLAGDYYQTSAGQRDRLLTATDRLNKTSDRIQQGRQQLHETEELGVQILSDLQRQRETILHSRDTLHTVDTHISRSRQILSTMSKRILQNKLIMWGIILLLLGAIGLVLWANSPCIASASPKGVSRLRAIASMVSKDAADSGGPAFLHGVGSFDPLPDGVIIWTRVTPSAAITSTSNDSRKGAQADSGSSSGGGAIAVDWVVSERSDFSALAASGSFTTDASRDWTVAVDVTGLRPATYFFYRFSVGKLHSVVGETKTTASGHLEELTFAQVCCSNWGFGRFHVYDLATRVDGLDFVLHCGDYIYEYGKGAYPERRFQARHGLRRPKHQCKTLEDFRRRYACYRTDAALQELHRRVPWVCVWDDHEVADSASVSTSDNSDGASRQEWEARKRSGVQAFSEWVPVRGLQPGAPDLAGCHRTLHFGDLITLMLVENRLAARTPPLDPSTTTFYKQTALKHPSEWEDGGAMQAAKEEFLAQLAHPRRQMIGAQQVADVRQAVQDSVAAGRPWQVFLSQTVFSPLRAPKLGETVGLQHRLLAWICRKALKTAVSEKRAGAEGAHMARMYLAFGRYNLPMNPGAYDGYQAERAELMEAFSMPGCNAVVLAGDSHNAWAHELLDARGRRVGVEFDAPAVTSPGFAEDIYSRFQRQVGRLAKLFPLYLFTPWVEDSLQAANPASLRFCNLNQRGLVLHHVTHGRWHTEFHFVNSVTEKEYRNYVGAAFNVEQGQRGMLHKAFRYLTVDHEIPKREQSKRSAFLRLLRGTRSIDKQQK